MGGPSSAAEQTIARIAARQHGIVKRGQLLEGGLSRRQIEGRLQKGLLILKHPGVYRVGHAAPSTEADYLAAVFACGTGAVLGHLAAAHLLGLIKGSPPTPEVVFPTQLKIRGVITHRSRVDRRDATVHRRIPVTTVPRTLVDLAALLPPDSLARACHEADVRYRVTAPRVEVVLARRPNSPGAAKLRAILRGDTRVTLSKLESRFLALLRENGLPLPQTNLPAGRHRVDCRWPEHRLTVELDGYRYHRSRHAWEADRRREREAYARGDAFRRFTWGDVFEHPRPVVHELRELLGRPQSTDAPLTQPDVRRAV